MAAQTAKARYDNKTNDRWQFLDRARQCAELSIPTLIPPEGHNPSTRYYTPWQGIGARGLNNLASKLLLAMFPPNTPFFKLVVDEITKDKLAGDPMMKSHVDLGFAKMERSVQDEFEASSMRNPLFMVLKHLICGGNALIYIPAKANMKIWPLERYVVSRDTDGNLLEAIAKEVVARDTLSPEILALADNEPDTQPAVDTYASLNKNPNNDPGQKDVEIYTRFYLEKNRWCSFQELNGHVIPGSKGNWALDDCPIIALRWTHVYGEDYGRGYIEEYIGDLISLEGLSKAVVEAAAASAKVLFLVNPNGVTKAKDITQANSGDAIVGAENDVHSLQAEKSADLRIAADSIKTITDRLAYAFMMNSAIQRNGERVTAEEIRYMAGELEDALGGVYSVLAQELQLPLVTRLMSRMTKQKKLPPLPKGVVKPAIITGMEALGRGHDAQALQQWISAYVLPAGQATQGGALKKINWDEFLTRGALSLNIDQDGLMLTDEQLQAQAQQDQQKAQQRAMMEGGVKAAPNIVKAASDHLAAQNAPPPAQGGGQT